MTSNLVRLDGLTHSPPMKKWSGAIRDTLAISVRLMLALLSVISTRPNLPAHHCDDRASVRSRIPSVARSAVSEMTGKMFASFHCGSISDQS